MKKAARLPKNIVFEYYTFADDLYTPQIMYRAVKISGKRDYNLLQWCGGVLGWIIADQISPDQLRKMLESSFNKYKRI